jgi:hypothetical protein
MTMISKMQAKLRTLQTSDSFDEIRTESNAMLKRDKLKEVLLKVLDEKLPESKVGRDAYNSERFHATQAVEDLVLVSEYYSSTERTLESTPEQISKRNELQMDFARKAMSAAERELSQFVIGLTPPEVDKKCDEKGKVCPEKPTTTSSSK